MRILTVLIPLLLLTFGSCSTGDVKEKLNKAGDVAGQTVGEFASGVSSGVEKAFEVNLTLNPSLAAKGVSLGKVTLRDSAGKDNVLTVYMIFSQEFNSGITAKVFDANNAEMGRVKVQVEAGKDEAKFIEFIFDSRTNIDTDCKVMLE